MMGTDVSFPMRFQTRPMAMSSPKTAPCIELPSVIQA